MTTYPLQDAPTTSPAPLSNVLAVLSTTRIDVAPDEHANLVVTVHNTSGIVDQFRVEVLGPASDWATVTPEVIGLFPGVDGSVNVRFTPPRTSADTLGEVPFAVKVTSEADPAMATVEEGTVQLSAFTETACNLKPKKVTTRRRAARFELQVENRGNRPTTMTLTGEDEEGLISFKAPPAVTVEPGAAACIPVKVAADKRRWTGRDRPRPFTLQVQAEDDPPLVLCGTFVQRALLSRRVIVALCALVAALLTLVLLWSRIVAPSIRTAARQEAALISSEAQAGPQGETGLRGPKGDAGQDGSAGQTGAKGADGAPGANGSAGATGPPGQQGAQGAAGKDGANGPQGAAGEDGSAGLQGPQGPAGSRGPAGPQGEKGEVGPVGPAGPAGAAGRDGISGYVYAEQPSTTLAAGPNDLKTPCPIGKAVNGGIVDYPLPQFVKMVRSTPTPDGGAWNIIVEWEDDYAVLARDISPSVRTFTVCVLTSPT